MGLAGLMCNITTIKYIEYINVSPGRYGTTVVRIKSYGSGTVSVNLRKGYRARNITLFEKPRRKRACFLFFN